MSGRNAPRSRNGCSTCRTRKVKCDEDRPACGRCRSAQLTCEWLPSPKRHRPPPAGPSHSSRALAIQNHRLLLPRDMFGVSTNQQLGNSLHLTVMDREYLVYFPHSAVVTWVGKPWKWGFLRYLYSNVASQSSIVMRLVLALSASELEGRRLADPSLPGGSLLRNQRVAALHYGAALREFRDILERGRDKRPQPSREDIDEIMTAFFFMIAYEQHFGRGPSGLTAHLSGVQAFLETCGVLATQGTELSEGFSEMSKNLLLYIMYIGLNHAALGGERERDAWLAMKSENIFSEFLDHLFQDSRDTNSIVFRGEYPPEALMDDIAVYQPLEFIHECIKLRHSLLFIKAGVNAAGDTRSLAHISRKLSMMRRRYGNLILISEAEAPPVGQRELQTIYYSVAEYHALEITCAQLGSGTGQRGNKGACLQDCLNKLLAVLKKIKTIDPRPMSRVCWPLAVAADVVQNPDERRWIRDAIENAWQVTGASTPFTLLNCS